MDKGKSFPNVSIEVKANIAKVSVCFLAVKNVYNIYICVYIYIYIIYIYISLCQSLCLWSWKWQSQWTTKKKNRLINWDYWYAKPVLEISDESANVFTVVNDK